MFSIKSLKRLIPEETRARFADLRGRGIYSGYPDKYQAIFIHIPKTGGTSVCAALFGAAVARHATWQQYEDVNRRKFRQYFKFAFVRNPWDRLVSAYFFHKNRAPKSAVSFKLVDRYPDFDRFVGDGLSRCELFDTVHFRPQVQFVMDTEGRAQVDFIGKYEQLEHDFRTIAHHLGMSEKSLPRLNAGTHCEFRSYYSAKTRRIVGRVYERDIEAFRYDFGPMQY